MDILDFFYVDEDNKIRLRTYVLVIRSYHDLEKTSFDDSTYYVNDADMQEWTEQQVPKHQLLELISKEELDTSEYAWMDGIKLRTDNHMHEIPEIAAYGSMEAYKASLPDATIEYLVDLDYQISKIKLGLE